MSKSRKHEDTPWTVVDASPTENQQEPRTESASLECDDTSWKTLAKRLMSKHTKNVGSKPHESVDHPVAHDVAILKEKNTVRLPKVLFWHSPTPTSEVALAESDWSEPPSSEIL